MPTRTRQAAGESSPADAAVAPVTTMLAPPSHWLSAPACCSALCTPKVKGRHSIVVNSSPNLKSELKSDPRGFGFVQFVNPEDAGEAEYQMDGQMFQGRKLTVVFAEENRKKPTGMRQRERGGREYKVVAYGVIPG